MKKVVIDYETCMRSGQCYHQNPNVFARDEGYWPKVLKEELAAEDLEAAEFAADVCPSGAISIVDES